MPFAKTAYLGRPEADILHYNAVKIQVSGCGQLKQKLWTVDEQDSFDMYDIAMAERTGIQPTTLANLISQDASFEVRTTTINDWFRINKIILYYKFFASEYPT